MIFVKSFLLDFRVVINSAVLAGTLNLIYLFINFIVKYILKMSFLYGIVLSFRTIILCDQA